MAQLIAFMLATAGLTHIIVYSRLFQPARNYICGWDIYWLNRLISCPKCMGVWAGLFEYAFVYVWPCGWLVYPFIGSLAAYVAAILIGLYTED